MGLLGVGPFLGHARHAGIALGMSFPHQQPYLSRLCRLDRLEIRWRLRDVTGA
jgi:hypothetical protein